MGILKFIKSGNAGRRLSIAKDMFFTNIKNERKPLIVNIGLTNKCNLKCTYCYGAYYLKDKSDFPLDDLLHLIDDLKSMGNRQIHLVGGEPLMHKDIRKIIEYLKKTNTYVTMVTNGTLISQKIDEVKLLDMVCVSLDGPSEINDFYRGKGTFDRALKGIECAIATKVPVRSYTLLTKKNYKSLNYLVGLSSEMNIGMIIELPYVPFRDLPELYLTDEEMRWSLQEIIKYKKEGYPIFGSIPVFEYAANWPASYDQVHFDTEPEFDYIKCKMGKFHAYIDTDGKVYSCVAKLAQKMEVLNCQEVGFKKAWDYLESKPCYTCYHPSLNEYNLFYAKSWKVWRNLLKSNLREFGVLGKSS